ncbi:SDR family NAD(P)-dependent oxidoreductase [Hydrogenophaga sp. BPS33]|uniref:SDR family NAD(P)-dependent oxidoreductase n=1 Tax=Hydrogenophaga sp. BPS33 TaxID=2651974 RepID=UPI001359755F|nr:SDR family oxidoreductase [Hydrogenophaga sp. BPS33]
MPTSPIHHPQGTVLLVGAQEPLADAVLQRLQHDGHDVMAIPGGDETALQAALKDLTFDALVTVTPTARANVAFDDIDDAAFEAAVDVQLLGVVRTAQAALPRLREGARIVHVGSRGHQGAWGGVHQMAASAGLVAMTRSMALELQPEGFFVNLVASEFEHERQDTPHNREAVAHAVGMLASPHNRITGQCLVIDGLASLRMSEARRPPVTATN